MYGDGSFTYDDVNNMPADEFTYYHSQFKVLYDKKAEDRTSLIKTCFEFAENMFTQFCKLFASHRK